MDRSDFGPSKHHHETDEKKWFFYHRVKEIIRLKKDFKLKSNH